MSAAASAPTAPARAEAWQTLLAAELPSDRAEPLAKEIEAGTLDRAGIMGLKSLTPAEAERIGRAGLDALHSALDLGLKLIERAEYPEHLARTRGAPPALFCWGDWQAAHATAVAIVGTRGASTYGKAVAMKYAEALAASGVTVVSGGALGVDAAAHKGALQAGGKTIAVLAGGVEKVYPAIHGSLFRKIREEGGCLVSQFAVGSKPNSYKFLVRNGLIAALSHALVLVEAPLRSGALATANAANELGRQVFVVPANIDSLSFAGSHALIRDGATLTDHPHQVLEALGISPAAPITQKGPQSKTAQLILGVLSMEPKSPERIVDDTGLEASVVLSELTMLELEGSVLRDAGGYATRP